jgi:hypothetical protein
MTPNADSSPLWSLADQSPQSAAPSETQEVRMSAMAEINGNGAHAAQTAEPEPQSHIAPPQSDVATPEDAPPPGEPPKDPRKGWWQRRFKM